VASAGGGAAPGFARDIRPLFRDSDIDAMRWLVDLGSYTAVTARAELIYREVASGTMPCDGAWPPDRVALVRRWIDAGCPP
jgi:hypothetical protein